MEIIIQGLVITLLVFALLIVVAVICALPGIILILLGFDVPEGVFTSLAIFMFLWVSFTGAGYLNTLDIQHGTTIGDVIQQIKEKETNNEIFSRN